MITLALFTQQIVISMNAMSTSNLIFKKIIANKIM